MASSAWSTHSPKAKAWCASLMKWEFSCAVAQLRTLLLQTGCQQESVSSLLTLFHCFAAKYCLRYKHCTPHLPETFIKPCLDQSLNFNWEQKDIFTLNHQFIRITEFGGLVSLMQSEETKAAPANGDPVVSRFGPKLISGSESQANRGVHEGVETFLHTLHSSSLILAPCLLPFLPNVDSLVRSLAHSSSLPCPLPVSSLWLAKRAASSPPSSASRRIYVTSWSPNCVTLMFITMIAHCGITYNSLQFFFKRKSPLKLSG